MVSGVNRSGMRGAKEGKSSKIWEGGGFDRGDL